MPEGIRSVVVAGRFPDVIELPGRPPTQQDRVAGLLVVDAPWIGDGGGAFQVRADLRQHPLERADPDDGAVLAGRAPEPVVVVPARRLRQAAVRTEDVYCAGFAIVAGEDGDTGAFVGR